MKIALIGLRLTVGPRLIVDTMGPALARRGHDVVFVGVRHPTPAPVRSVAVNEGDSYAAMLAQTFTPSYYRTVIEALKREKPDLCYFIAVHPSNGPLCRMIRSEVVAADGSTPQIAVHIHDPVPHPGAAWPLIFSAQQIMAHMADQVVVFGRALARQMATLYGIPRRRMVVIRHGASRPPREAAPDVPERYAHFSFLGRIAGYKGLGLFLQAARQLVERRPDARFYVGGTGGLGRYRADLRALGNAVTVENRELSNEETDRVMQNSWAVVLPYTSGTQSGVIPIAYWNASPVITTSVCALPEAVVDGQTGFIVPPWDAGALERRMHELWDNAPVRQQLGHAAFGHYRRLFQWDQIAEQPIRHMQVPDLVGEEISPSETVELGPRVAR